VTEHLYQLTPGYRVFDERTTVDVLGAARYTQLDTKLNKKVALQWSLNGLICIKAGCLRSP